MVLGAGGVLGGSEETCVSEARNNILGTSGERGDGVSQSVGPEGMNHEEGPEGMNNEGAPVSFQGLDGRVAAVSFQGFGGGVSLPLLDGSKDWAMRMSCNNFQVEVILRFGGVSLSRSTAALNQPCGWA